MLETWMGRGFGMLVAATVALTIGTAQADASSRRGRTTAHSASATHGKHFAGRYRHGTLRHWASVLQCVPFARENTGIELSGNAATWWDNADGLYERGAKPEVGSILNFRASGRMRMGHVAVVTNVIDSRHIEIDHANWSGPGRISRDIDVVDVSANNDWTAVRVALGQSDDTFGSIYPTYGFIYDRPDAGTMVANTGLPAASTPVLNAAPADLRPVTDRIQLATVPTAPEEVAEAADDPAPRTYRRHGRARIAAHAKSSHRLVAMRTSARPSVTRVVSHATTAHHRRRF